ERVAVLPPPGALDDVTQAMRWGADGALRAGAGTLRERAELLKAMLEAMGATAKVKAATWPSGLTAQALAAARPPAFRLEAGTNLDLVRMNAAGPQVNPAPVVEALLAALPAEQAKVASPVSGVGASLPVVEYTLDGVTRWAFAAGELGEVDAAPAGLTAELSPVSLPKVSVRLLALFGDLPGVPSSQQLVELVKGTWSTEQLVGNRLQVSFPPPDVSSFTADPEGMPLRSPALALQGLATREALWRPSGKLAATPPVTGPVISLSGGRVFDLGGGALEGPYGPIATLSESRHAEVLGQVATLEVVAQGGAFPDVVLTVAAKDGSGAGLEGLSAADFAVSDEGKPQALTLLSNAGVTRPKVMLAYDCSGSVSWAAPADKAAFDDALAQALESAGVAATYDLGLAAMGAQPTGWSAPNATAIKSFAATCVSASDVWTALGDAALVAGATAVVVVSDFDASDVPERIPALQARLAASGLAVAVIGAGTTVKEATLADVVRLSGGKRFDPKDAGFTAALTGFVVEAAKRARASAYRLTYRVPREQRTASGMRTATVALAARAAVSGSAPYEVPVASARGQLGVGGLYLELTVNGRAVTRRLSGPVANRFGTYPVPGAADFVETQDLIAGVTTVAFEPGSPTTGANLDDLIASVLSLEPLGKTVGQPLTATLSAAEQLRVYSGALAALVDPGPASTLAVTPEQLRVVVMTETAGYHGLQRRLDVVPELNRAVVASSDAAAAFRAALSSTVALSLREGIAVKRSAAAALAGAALQYVAPFASPSSLEGFSAEELARWQRVLDQYSGWHRFVPKTPAPGALWVVDPATGTAVAVFLDGSGGGKCDDARWNAGLQAELALLTLCAFYQAAACEAAKKGGSAPGVYACVGAKVASVGAGVASLLAGYFLTGAEYYDLAALVISVIATLGPVGPAVGGIVGLGTLALSLYETADAVAENC
ncbi:MAG: hypothetical protein K1X89_25755, partial [Myxococcaceae bacterium]|nr:hypothetical protein [Myxococcaceae bacterium]